MNFKLIFSYPELLLLSIILLILIGTYIYYRKTIPDLNRADKILLALFRLIVLIILIFSTGELAIESISTNLEYPVTAILVDDSKSMSIEKDEIQDKMRKIINKLAKSKYKFELIKFNSKSSFVNPDSLEQIDFNGHLTNISSPINEIIKNKNEKNYQNVILITDGIYNSGENPIYLSEKSENPFFIIGVGDPKPKIDISINDILTNDFVYAQNQTPIRVSIKSNGFENQQTTISLFEDNKLLDKRNFQLQGNYQEIEFFYTPQHEGDKKLSFSIAPLKGEYTEKNNFASKYIKVLSNKIRVLTVAGKPSYDLSFINQSIKSNKDFQLETLIEKPNGEFYPLFNNERFIDSADIILFIGFPASINSERLIKKIYNKIEKDNTPLFILINPDTDFNRLSLFKSYLPFDWRSAFGTASQVLIDVPEDKSKNEIINLGQDNSANLWNNFPPIYRVDRDFLSKPESEILAFYKIGNTRINQPLILSRNLNKHRSIAFIGFNIWRLKLLNAMREEESIYFDRFINNSIKWLTTKKIEKNLIVKPLKKIFDINEKITFTAQFYDDSNQPVENEQITLDIYEKGKKIISTLFKPLGNGIYTAELENLQNNDYQYLATALLSGKKFQDEGKFTVTESEIEFRDLTLREDLLKRMAMVTKGSYVHISQSDEFINNLQNYLNKKPKEKEISNVFYAWNSIYTLILIILFLSFEWFLRKRWGLM